MHARKAVELAPRFDRRKYAAPDVRTRSYDMGAQARAEGRAKSSCPFAHGVARRDWMRGFNEG